MYLGLIQQNPQFLNLINEISIRYSAIKPHRLCETNSIWLNLKKILYNNP